MIRYKGFQIPNIHELAYENRDSDKGFFVTILHNKELDIHDEVVIRIDPDDYNKAMSSDDEKYKEDQVLFFNRTIMEYVAEYIGNRLWIIKAMLPDSVDAAIIQQHEEYGDWPITKMNAMKCSWESDYNLLK